MIVLGESTRIVFPVKALDALAKIKKKRKKKGEDEKWWPITVAERSRKIESENSRLRQPRYPRETRTWKLP